MENKYKYPRTYHLPWSLGKTNDDKTLRSTDHFIGKEVVVTEKMDGENTTLYRDYVHARSLDGRHHPSRNWVKSLQATIGHQIPENWRVCGENLYARHSIGYTELSSYFMAFSCWNDENICLDWDSTCQICADLNLITVPLLWRGIYNEDTIHEVTKDLDTEIHEGYVVRLASEFRYEDFNISVAKCVRANHVQSEDHWMHQQIIPNTLLQPSYDTEN